MNAQAVQFLDKARRRLANARAVAGIGLLDCIAQLLGNPEPPLAA